MAEFVEKGDHVVVRHQAWPIADGRLTIAIEISNGRLQLALGTQPAVACVVHPRATAFG